MSLKHFLQDLYDTEIVNIDISQIIDVARGELQYGMLFKDTHVIDSLKIANVWHSCFGTWPSLFDIRNIKTDLGQVIISCESIQQWISTNTFFKYIPDMIKSKTSQIKLEYDSMQQRLTQPDLVKQELISKLAIRYGRIISASSESLFKLYTKQIYHETPGVQTFINPLTNLELQTNKPTAELDMITARDQLQYNITSDHYFMRSIVMQTVIYIYGQAPINMINGLVSAFEKAVVVFSTSNINIHRGVKHFLLESEEQFLMIPNIGRNCIIIDLEQKRGYITPAPITGKPLLIISNTDRHKTDMDIICYNDTEQFIKQADYNPILYTGQQNQQKTIINTLEFYTHYFSTIFKPNADIRYRMALSFLSRLYMKSAKPAYAPAATPTNAVVLIDNRSNIMSVLSAIITMGTLSDAWQLIIITKKENYNSYQVHLGGYKPVMMTHHIQYNEPFDIEDYNTLLKDPAFWKLFQAYDKVLTIQDDGMLIKQGIERFLSYDYVGAPWNPHHPENVILDKVCNPNLVGNGGLSLRSTKAMIEISSKYVQEKQVLFNNDLSPIPEDVYFAKCVYKYNYKLPTSSEALGFASEQLISLTSIGLHKVWHYHMPDVVTKYYDTILNE